MRAALVLLLLMQGMIFTAKEAKAQDLTGQWTGVSTDNNSNVRHKIVLNIASGDSLFAGVLHWYYPAIQLFRNFIIRGQFHSRDSTISIREDSAMEEGVQVNEAEGSGPYVLYYKRTAHKEILEGHWSRVNMFDKGAGRTDSAGSTIDIRLEKKATPFIPIPPIHKHKDSAATHPKGPEIFNGRQTPLVMAIPVPVKLDSIKIELYDNGEVDGDSVSLYLNDQLIAAHVKLLAQPRVIWLNIDKGLPVNKLVLFAENLGTLPPNTALMEVTVRGKKYPVFLSTDYKRNAMVEFILQE